jgi:hypothetical protein
MEHEHGGEGLSLAAHFLSYFAYSFSIHEPDMIKVARSSRFEWNLAE